MGVMPEPEVRYEATPSAPKLAVAVFAVIAILLGLLYTTSLHVNEQRAISAAEPGYAEFLRSGEEPGQRGVIGAVKGLVAQIQALRMEIRESESGMGLGLLNASLVVLTLASIWCLVQAMGVSVGWGIAIFATQWFGMLAFASYHWEEARGPATLAMGGVGLMILGIALL